MARIFWDSNVFIYYLEDHPVWADAVESHRDRMLSRGDTLCSSWLTVGEVLTMPCRVGNELLERRYRDWFGSGVVQLLSFGPDAAMAYARLRGEHRVRPADAMQLACAASAGTDVFVTNDKRLHALRVPGITFIVGLDHVP